MNFCPSHEQLLGLLSNDLLPAEWSAYARHVEDCSSCQEHLDRLTRAVPISALSRGTQQPLSDRMAEEDAVRRLKQMWLAPTVRLRGGKKRDKSVDAPRRNRLAGDRPIVPGYEIVGELGRGGMGVVYEARQLGLQRTVALKMLLSGTLEPKDLARFRCEAEAVARLQHPNIVQIYDVGEVSGRPYFVLEFVSGGNLAQFLQGRPLPVRAAAQLIEILARAVHVAHVGGVIHRDLKPANILLQETGISEAFGVDQVSSPNPNAASPGSSFLTPKIADFGVAKCDAGGSNGDTTIAYVPTVTGEVVGTPNYMAPEQAMVPRQPVGPGADVYALGAILYELLTGRPPFTGDGALDIVLQVLHNDPVSVKHLQPHVPPDLETICLKCLRKDPKARYRSALELAEDARRFLQGETIRARPIGVWEKLWRWVLRRPLMAGLLAAGLLGPLVAFVTLTCLSARLIRSSALESAAQQAELLEEATREFSRNVQRVEHAKYPVNKTVPPTPNTVPLSIPATFLHDVAEQLARTSRTGIRVRQVSDHSFPWRKDSGPQDEFERAALKRLRETNGRETAHEFTEIDGQRVVRFAQARVMQRTCVECHNSHPQSPKKDWKEGDVRGVLEIIRPLDNDEARVYEALRMALLLSTTVSILLFGAGLLLLRSGRARGRFGM